MESFTLAVQEEQEVTGVNAYTSVKQAHDKAYNTMIGTGLAVLEDYSYRDWETDRKSVV